MGDEFTYQNRKFSVLHFNLCVKYVSTMKKVNKLLVIVALGAMTLSCQDENFNEVEETVLEEATSDPIDAADREEDIPGQ